MKNWRTSAIACLAVIAEGLQHSANPQYQLWGGILFKLCVPLGLLLSADASHPSLQIPAPAAASEDPRQSKLPGVVLLCVLGFSAFVGCAHLQPGADPLIVRAEQTETLADSTFSLFLHLEKENAALVKTNFPPAHQFAEWLRAPEPVHGTNMPRASALIFSLNDVKAAYRADRSQSNLLVTATATLTEALNQAAQWTQNIKPPTPAQ